MVNRKILIKQKLRNKIKKSKKIIFILGLVVLFIFLGVFIFDSNRTEIHDKKDKKKYSYDITYPVIHNRVIDKDIKQVIKNKKKALKQKSKKNKFNLKIIYNKKKYQDISTIHFSIYWTKNDKIVDKENIILNYSSVSYKYVKLSSYFKKESNYQAYLMDRMYYYVLDYASRDKAQIDREKLKMILNENFDSYFFDEEGLHLIVYSSSVSNYLHGTYEKIFKYQDIKKYLSNKSVKIFKVSDEQKRKTRDVSIFNNQKIVSITFDDGPSPVVTPRLLEELDKRNVKATFFTLGSRSEKNPDIIKKMYLDGHDIGIHTYSHLNLKTLSDDKIYSEKESCVKIIESITGFKPTLMRPPYGSIDDRVKSIFPMKSIIWSVDSLDWKSKNKDAVYKEIMSHTEDGDIILLHDLYNTSVDGVLLAIDELRNQGYQFLTISEMMELKGDTKDTYFHF